MTVTSSKEKKILYAKEYVLTNDPLQAYVKAGYVKSVEEAKESRNYKTPLKSKIVQAYIKDLTSTKKEITKEVKILSTKSSLKKEIKSYIVDNEYGMDIQAFLIDIAQNPNIYPKDRLTAVELLLKYTSGYYGKSDSQNVNVGVVFNEDYH